MLLDLKHRISCKNINNNQLNWSLLNRMYYICRYNDPPYVKLRKLDLLTQVCDDVNAHDIVQELGLVSIYVCLLQ